MKREAILLWVGNQGRVPRCALLRWARARALERMSPGERRIFRLWRRGF